MNVKRFDSLAQDVLVIDEADDLLSKQTRSICQVIESVLEDNSKQKKDLQIILVAATVKDRIKGQDFINFVNKTFGKLKIHSTEDFGRINKNIDHKVLYVDGMNFDQKMEILLKLIDQLEMENLIIFSDNSSQETLHQALVRKSLNTFKINRS